MACLKLPRMLLLRRRQVQSADDALPERLVRGALITICKKAVLHDNKLQETRVASCSRTRCSLERCAKKHRRLQKNACNVFGMCRRRLQTSACVSRWWWWQKRPPRTSGRPPLRLASCGLYPCRPRKEQWLAAAPKAADKCWPAGKRLRANHRCVLSFS